MFHVTRRQALVTSGGLLAAGSCTATLRHCGGRAIRSTSPTTSTYRLSIRIAGPSSVNPTIQAIYRSIFDQYIGQNPDVASSPDFSRLGLEQRQDQGLVDVREDVDWHDGSPFTPET